MWGTLLANAFPQLQHNENTVKIVSITYHRLIQIPIRNNENLQFGSLIEISFVHSSYFIVERLRTLLGGIYNQLDDDGDGGGACGHLD